MKALVPLLALPAMAAANPADDVLIFAHCLGQADGYAADAAEYGYDAEAAVAENDLTLQDLEAHAGAAELTEARARGLEDWEMRVAEIKSSGTGMSGPAWEAHVKATALCGEVAYRLREKGWIE